MQSLTIAFTGQEELRLESLPVPEPGAGELLLETRASLISSGTECICYQRNFEPGTHWHRWVQYPFYPGYSNSGLVAGWGEGVTGFERGQKVAYRAGHRQYAVLPAADVTAVPDGVSHAEAAWIALAKIVQNGVRRAEHVMGDDVVVIGLGILGQLVIQYVRLLGARRVIGIDPAAPRLEYAALSGATHALPLRADQALASVQAITAQRLADVVYDVTGFPQVFASALALPRKFGTVLLLGDTGTPSGQQLSSHVITQGLRIVAAHDSHPPPTSSDFAYWSNQKIAELFFTYLARGQMNVKDLISHRYAPAQAQEAYAMLIRDRASAMGVLFDWTQL